MMTNKNVVVSVSWSKAAQSAFPAVNKRAFNAVARRAIQKTVITVAVFPTSSTRYEVALSFVSDEEIHQLNLQYRNKNKPTDVLSFAQNDGEAFPYESDDAPQMLGDLVISIETVRRQAAERAHSIETETEFLCVHGALHLLGFDHIKDAERRKMWKQQDGIVELLKSA